jgi:hypothetical protein
MNSKAIGAIAVTAFIAFGIVNQRYTYPPGSCAISVPYRFDHWTGDIQQAVVQNGKKVWSKFDPDANTSPVPYIPLLNSLPFTYPENFLVVVCHLER